MKSKIQKGLIALFITGLLGFGSGCGLFDWSNDGAQSSPAESTSLETVSAVEESESGNLDENTDSEAQSSAEKEEESSSDTETGGGQSSLPKTDSSEEGSLDNSTEEDSSEQEQSFDGKIELPEDKFD